MNQGDRIQREEYGTVSNGGYFTLEKGWSYVENKRAGRAEGTPPDYLTAEVANTVRRFHQGIKGYKTTPLVALEQFANELNIGGIYVKDLSSVLGLDSFKVLGASYAVFRLLCKTLSLNEETASFADLRSIPKDKFTFVTATDGNFGKAVAWVAHQLRQKTIVYVPHNMIMRRRNAIETFGAKVLEPKGEDKSFDGAMHELSSYLGKDSYLVVSDTSWEGYAEIPRNVMQGYLTMCDEAAEQLSSLGLRKPSHIFVQAGCGGLAASIVGYYNSLFGNDRPISIIVEPTTAACLLQSARIGKWAKVKLGDTIMAGLSCGEPSILAWPVLHNYAHHFVAMPDDVALYGMRVLADPKPPDKAIISGETGAAGMGCLTHILKANPDFAKKLGITRSSTILLFNTEGATGE